MSRYTSGIYAKFISDRSGMEFPYKERIKEWNGSIVHISEYEAKHPQLEPIKPVIDPQALYDARTDRTEPEVARLLPHNPFKTGTSGSSTITITEYGHGRTAGTKVRFRNVYPFDGITISVMENSSGHTIASVVDTSTYTVSVSDTATVGSVKGGGDIASAGPVTLEK